jgi:AraC-like DNA-binding protein
MSLPAGAWLLANGLGGATSPGSPVLLVLGLAAALAAALALWRQGRDRRRMAELLGRLERLEATLQARVAPPAAAAGRNLPPDPISDASHLSADVLHGRTTWVRQLVERPPEPFQSLADQAVLRVHEGLAANLTPAELADTLCVSLRTLERGLAQTLACSPRQLILAVKMREARRLLRQGARVGEVAERLGFVSAFHFSRRFKEFYHVPPSEMRPPAGEGRPPGAPPAG